MNKTHLLTGFFGIFIWVSQGMSAPLPLKDYPRKTLVEIRNSQEKNKSTRVSLILDPTDRVTIRGLARETMLFKGDDKIVEFAFSDFDQAKLLSAKQDPLALKSLNKGETPLFQLLLDKNFSPVKGGKAYLIHAEQIVYQLIGKQEVTLYSQPIPLELRPNENKVWRLVYSNDGHKQDILMIFAKIELDPSKRVVLGKMAVKTTLTGGSIRDGGTAVKLTQSRTQ